MDRDQLAAAHATAIHRHWRTLTDTDGKPPNPLLDDLAAIADQHHITEVAKLADTPSDTASATPKRRNPRKTAKPDALA